MGGIGILGGTFNPVHIGHIRHALEVGEALGLDKVLLTPCAVPPHKAHRGLLPFALRVDLIRAAIKDIARLGVNTLEGELEGPSYTFISLEEWRRRQGREGRIPYFLLGVEDFAALNSWYRGLELPCLAHLVVVPRAGSDRELFFSVVRRFWPNAGPVPTMLPAECADLPPSAEGMERVTMELKSGGRCTFLPVPRLDISASFVRARWLADRDIHGLIPEAVRQILEDRRSDADQAWMRTFHT